MEEIMLKIDNVSKQYKLGQIGGTTLRDELQRRRAKMLGKEDPTKKIGAKDYNKGETFMALNGVSFEVKKGEAVGIIGHNGAGKSTLLKLISRVTAPTGGAICMNGRVASMLEVGTGFHGELTGRENIYMNGAILGMTKKEIDAKIEDIIEFSEVRQFIDTPVKRYSSGMYVKLAFSVAAHLDSEIMIMDEVLAVGDMAFQKKCLTKMREAATKEGRTVLYVSHNMNTIRQLCDRVIVLDHGKVVFDGDVEEGIQSYIGNGEIRNTRVDTRNISRRHGMNRRALISEVSILNDNNGTFREQDRVRIRVNWENHKTCDSLIFRLFISNSEGKVISTAITRMPICAEEGKQYSHELSLNLNNLAPDVYFISILLTNYQEIQACDFDILDNILAFEVVPGESDPFFYTWNVAVFGQVKLPEVICKEVYAV